MDGNMTWLISYRAEEMVRDHRGWQSGPQTYDSMEYTELHPFEWWELKKKHYGETLRLTAYGADRPIVCTRIKAILSAIERKHA